MTLQFGSIENRVLDFGPRPAVKEDYLDALKEEHYSTSTGDDKNIDDLAGDVNLLKIAINLLPEKIGDKRGEEDEAKAIAITKHLMTRATHITDAHAAVLKHCQENDDKPIRTSGHAAHACLPLEE